MPSVRQSLIARGGIAATFELYADGHGRADLAQAVRTRAVLRIRQGWYGRPDLHPDLIAAVRVGGRLTCASALALLGGWNAAPGELHVAVPANSCRPRAPGDSRVRLLDAAPGHVTLHWRSPGDGIRGIATPMAAVDDAVRCLPPDRAAAAIGMLLHERPGLVGEWRAWLAQAPYPRARWLREVDGICESGGEGLWWFRMRGHRLRIRRQVRIPGVGRVDFVVGLRLVVEVDGAEYHTDPARFEADRRKDAALSSRGYRVLRFSYLQVVERWGEVETAVLAAVMRGDAG